MRFLTAVRAGALLLLGSTTTGAQIVRGTVLERTTSTPLPGIVVTLLPAGPSASPSDSLGRSTLTNERGEYAVRAPGPGHYRIAAKRIGVRRTFSEPFELVEGATHRLNIELDAVLPALPEVAVIVAPPLCAARPEQEARLRALWDEASTALFASQLARRDTLFLATVERYFRVVDARSLRVVGEDRKSYEGLFERPFASLSGDSLSKVGYWRELPNDSTAFYGPDADVLLSEAFLRDHCFTVQENVRDRGGLVGLGFAPVAGRQVPEVRGTIWLDARSFELRFAEFRYTWLPRTASSDRIGGEVHFARLPNGAWAVSRWYIRMPVYQRIVADGAGDRGSYDFTRTRSLFNSPTLRYLAEEGGTVHSARIAVSRTVGVVRGVALDSLGRPMTAVTIALEGTERSATADAEGRFELHDVPTGRYVIAAAHDDYVRFGLPAASQEIDVEADSAATVRLMAADYRALATAACNGRAPDPTRSTLRVTVTDSLTSQPARNTMMRLQWTEYAVQEHGDIRYREVQPRSTQATTDESGAVVFCHLPARIGLELGFVINQDRMRSLGVFRLRPEQFMTSAATGTPPM